MKSTNTAARALLGCLAPLLLAWPLAADALESDLSQPILIEADSLEINDREGTSLYRGNVEITQGTIHITADSVKVTQRKEGADQILAKGRPVTFRQQTDPDGTLVEGEAETAEYAADSDTLVLTGNALLKQGQDSFASDRIIYDRARSIVKAGTSAQGKTRVRVSIQPERKQPEQ
jgi:lipopolysaccharide export system protein LptA